MNPSYFIGPKLLNVDDGAVLASYLKGTIVQFKMDAELYADAFSRQQPTCNCFRLSSPVGVCRRSHSPLNAVPLRVLCSA
jgi:hypothetical protein